MTTENKCRPECAGKSAKDKLMCSYYNETCYFADYNKMNFTNGGVVERDGAGRGKNSTGGGVRHSQPGRLSD